MAGALKNNTLKKIVSLLFLSVLLFSSPTTYLYAQAGTPAPAAPAPAAPAPTPDECADNLDKVGGTIANNPNCKFSISVGDLLSFTTDALLAPLGYIAYVIFQLISGITILAGTLLNFIADYTIVKMAKNIQNSVITSAWGTIRDVANMAFIFVLLYAAIKKILGVGKDTQQLIVRLIVVAILINFSLFATKVVIDSSNILAMTFYDAISPGALADGNSVLNAGLSNSLMEPLGLNGLMKEIGPLAGKKILMISIMGSIFSLIAAFVFFAISLMLIIRFVVLIFVMILSPIAFIAFILPGMGEQKTQWVNALVGQAFFAPIYFMLTWVVIIVMRGFFSVKPGVSMGQGLSTLFTENADKVSLAAGEGSLQIFMNFIIIIVFLIASLLIAKKMSDKAGPAVAGLTKSALGYAGAGTMGLAGRFGRRTLGAAGQRIAESKTLKDMKEDGGMGGFSARLAMAAGRKTAGSSFDMRGSGMGKTLGAGTAQKGGYKADMDERAKRKADEAKRDAPTEAEKQKAQKMRTSLENSGTAKAEENLATKRSQLKEKEEALAKNGSTMTPEEVTNAEQEIATLRAEVGSAEDHVATTLQNVDPQLQREYAEEKRKQTASAEKLEKEATEAEKKANARDSSLSDQEKYHLKEDASNKRERATQKRDSVSSHYAYIDSVLGVDPKEVERRKAQVENQKQEAIKSAEEGGASALKNDSIIVAAQEQEKVVEAAEKDLETAESKVSLIITADTEAIKSEVAAKKANLETVKAQLKEKKKAAEIRTTTIKQETSANIANINKEHDARKEQIKVLRSVGDRRKEALAQGEESGWVTGKIGRKLEGVADREKLQNNRVGRFAASVLRQTGRTVRHNGVNTAAEMRKGKPPALDQIKMIMDEAGMTTLTDTLAKLPPADTLSAPAREKPEGEAK